jgi:D-alanine-D-alanine ligase
MRVTVLYGGPSAERDVSLVSGKAVARGLREAGHDVFEVDIRPEDLSPLDRACDVVFPVLHGAWGESGELQEILEQRGLPFVGSGSRASRLGMDKVLTKRAWEAAGLPTPPYQVCLSDGYDRAKGPDKIKAPCAVKAFDSGSSIDVFVCKAQPDANRACEAILSKHGKVLVERFIKGPELTVGLLEEKPLAPIRIVPKREFFDYEAKYKSNETEHRFDTGMTREVVERCRELARLANNVVGARDLARVDIMLDEADGFAPYLLEINTLPGFTSRSLLPEAAAHGGIPFAQLVDRLVRRAHARGRA